MEYNTQLSQDVTPNCSKKIMTVGMGINQPSQETVINQLSWENDMHNPQSSILSFSVLVSPD